MFELSSGLERSNKLAVNTSSEPDLRGELPVRAPEDLNRAIHLERFGAKRQKLKMFCLARYLPAIVFAVVFVREQIKLGLKLLQILYTSRLACM